MRRYGLVPAAALLALLLLLNLSSGGVFAAPNNGSAAIAKAASEKEVLPAPEDPRDADGELKMIYYLFFCRAGKRFAHWPSEWSLESALFCLKWPQLLSSRLEDIKTRRCMRSHSEKEPLKLAHCSFFIHFQAISDFHSLALSSSFSHLSPADLH